MPNPMSARAGKAAIAAIVLTASTIFAQQGPPGDGPPSPDRMRREMHRGGRDGGPGGPGGPGPMMDGRGPRGDHGGQGGPGGGPGGMRGMRGDGPDEDVEPVELNGTVQGFNYGPAGSYESMEIKTEEKSVQVNFPPLVSGYVASVAKIGEAVKLTARPQMGPPDHAIYELATLQGTDEKKLSIPTRKPRPVEDDEAKPETLKVDGKVSRLNYGRRGEINGVVLESGDFVRVGSREARSLNLKVGDTVSVEGPARPMLLGHNQVDADTINGKSARPTTRPSPDQRPMRRGPGGFDERGDSGPGMGEPNLGGPEMDGPDAGGPGGPPPMDRVGGGGDRFSGPDRDRR
jgi:hypothetical protein